MFLHRNVFIVVMILVLVLGGLVLFFLDPLSLWKQKPSPQENGKAFWVEVVTPEVVAKEEGTEPRILRTGDELKEGVTVEVRKGGTANLYFPDGSVARLDSETSVIVHSALFRKDKNILAVSLELIVGRVWSRVVSLITPESLWEVKTSNAIASVRGTTFDVEHTATSTRILGVEGVIKIVSINRRINEATLTKNTYIEIPNDIAKQPKQIEVRQAFSSMLNQSWVLYALQEDKMLKELQEAKPEAREFLEFIRFRQGTSTEKIEVLPHPPIIPKVSGTTFKKEKEESVLVPKISQGDNTTAQARNEKRRIDVNTIWGAINRNIIDGDGVFGGVGAQSCVGLSLPTEESNIANSNFGGLPNFDLSCLIPKYLDRMPLDPDVASGGHYWDSADDYFTGYQVFFDQDENEVVVFSIRAEDGERIYKGGSGFLLLPGDKPFTPSTSPSYTL